MHLSRALIPVFLLCSSFASAQLNRQHVLSGGKQSYDEGLFTPFEDLSALYETEFSTLGHPAFPRHSVRVKKSTFCDGTVNSYTGYIDIEARHLFFYFFESRSNPDEDDVILWINGGPGASSATGLFMELGPCRISDANGTKFFAESWNSNANVFFVDQPVGVGFSYADHGETVGTTEDAAKDMAAFLAIFLENSKLKGRPFHLAGESYGGRYIPLFAAEVFDQNDKLIELGVQPINLTSIIIGNGYTDFYTMNPSYFDMACTAKSIGPVLDIKTCIRMKEILPRCQQWLKQSCVDVFDAISCRAASTFCDMELMVPMYASGLNPYDITRKCEGSIEDGTCYTVSRHIEAYLNLPEVRETLGVDSVPANFSLSSPKVNMDFSRNMDLYHPTYHYVAALLERDVKVLIYAGTSDWICNHLANEKWTQQLEWTGQEEFSAKQMREWNVDGKIAGLTKSAKGLTFATIFGAGHMVPYDKPKESLELVNRWIGHKAL